MLIALDNKKNRVSINDTLVNNKYYCPLCNEELVLRKGFKRCHHFAHKANGMCSESKYSDMCEWHIKWQERFPKENIEIIKIDEVGKKHIADVLINNNEIEFQHSYMPFEEFNDRNEFYNKFNYHVIWIFDGNDIFDKGYNDGFFPFSKKFECLKKLKRIPEYLDIFIEGNIQDNLFTESGLFLHHIGNINEKYGVEFDGKITIENFIKKINSKELLNFKQEKLVTKMMNFDDVDIIDEQTLIDIVKQHPSANYLIVYNVETEYEVLIDRENMNKIIKGIKAYGKIKNKGNYGKFLNDKSELYYVSAPLWIYKTRY